MELIAPANSLLFWLAVAVFTFAIAAGVLRRWVLGRPGVRRGAVYVGAFIGVAAMGGVLPSAMLRAISKGGASWATPETAAWWSGALLVGVAGLAFLGRGIIGDPSRGRRRCGKCWYDMSATAGMQCPECGRKAGAEGRLFRTRRPKRWFAVALLVLAAASMGVVVPLYRQTDWEEWVPNVALVVMLPHLEDGDLAQELHLRVRREWHQSEAKLGAWDSGWRSRMMVRRCRVTLDGSAQPIARETAAMALGNIADGCGSALEELFLLAADPGETSTMNAIALSSLARVPAAHARLTPLLVAALDAKDQGTRMMAMGLLARMSAETSGGLAVPPRLLEIAAGDTNGLVQMNALGHLGSFTSSDSGRDVVIGMLESPDVRLQCCALSALPGHVTDAERLHPILLRFARADDANLRLQAVQLIAEHGPYTDEGLDELIRIHELSAASLGDFTGRIYRGFAKAPIPIERRLAVLERTLDHDALRSAGLAAIESLNDKARPLFARLERLRAELRSQGSEEPQGQMLDRMLWMLAPEDN